MKIGIDIRSLLDEPRSGVGEYTYNFLATIINKAPSDMTFVLFFSGAKIPKSIIDLKAEFSGNSQVEFYHLNIPNKIINFLWWLNLGPDLDKILKTKVIWMPNFSFVKISKQAKLIITCHDISFVHFRHLYSLKGRLWHNFVNPIKLYRRADFICSVSNQTKQDLITLGIDNKKIQTIYPIINLNNNLNNNLNTGNSEVSWKNLKIKFDLPDDFFLYIGTLDPRKNILALLEGYKKYKKSENNPIKLVIGGRLGWNSHRYYSQIFSDIDSNSDIYYLGYVPASYKSTLYSQAVGFIFPSLYEGFGFPPVEAMNNNCPVIASFTGSLPEVVRGAAILIDPYDVNSIAESFSNMHHDESIKTALKQKGSEVVDYWKQSQVGSVEKLLTLVKSFKSE